MATKSKKDYGDKLAIWNELAALDQKDYGYYDSLNDDQKKQFSTYLMLRWGSTVEGNGELAKYYAVATNEFVNTNFWDISKYPKLQWLVCCAVSPNLGKQKHYWLGATKGKSSSVLKTMLLEKLPNTKEDDIDMILKLHTKEEIKEWLRQWGIAEKTIKQII